MTTLKHKPTPQELLDDPALQLEESLKAIQEGRVFKVRRIIEPKTGTVHVIKERAEW